ncbi:MAG: insulinase family protein [Bacteroidetes bacterium]|nr:insulinase family protein [Bacteroidota bacterium]
MSNQDFRKIEPRVYPLSLPVLTNPQKVSKGIFGFFKEDTDVFRLDIVFPNAGIGNGISAKSGIICGEMLLSGTEKYSAQQLNENLDFYGSYTNIATSYYKTVLTVYGLNRYFEEIINLIAEAVNHSNFPEDELKILKKQKINNFRVQQQKTTYQCASLINKLWFGEQSILGKPTQEDDYNLVSREMLLDEFRKNFSKMFIILSSSPELKSKFNVLETLFKHKLTDEISFSAKPIEFVKELPSITNTFFKLSNANQASFKARLEVAPRNAKDYIDIAFLNLILGGYFGSRLMKNIREEKGWTYGVSSRIINYAENAFIEISGDINVDKAKEVKQEILKEFQLLQNKLIGTQEFETAKNYYLGNLQSLFDDFLSYSERHFTLLETNQTIEWYNILGKKIYQLTPEQILQAAQNYLDSKSLIYTWSGPNS